MDNYVCKIANEEDIVAKYGDSKENEKWKNISIERYKNNSTIIYIGLLNGEIISECSATIDPTLVIDSENLVDKKIAYLHAFYTKDDYQNQGYFSKLFKFMLADLKERGYEKVTLGVEPNALKNKEIYKSYGFTEYIKTIPETYEDGSIVNIEYYGKKI